MIKCTFCDNLMRETDLNCPFCGTPHDPVRQASAAGPHTIYELKQFGRMMGISFERLHFHIGENYKGRCAFGIYKDEKTGNFVVYKNKDNGERAIRYEGPDEAYAVNEIYQKLKERAAGYRNDSRNNPADLYRKPSRGELQTHRPNVLGIVLLVFGFIWFILMLIVGTGTGSSGSSSSGYGSSYRYESDRDSGYSQSYSDWDSDSGDWSSDW